MMDKVRVRRAFRKAYDPSPHAESFVAGIELIAAGWTPAKLSSLANTSDALSAHAVLRTRPQHSVGGRRVVALQPVDLAHKP